VGCFAWETGFWCTCTICLAGVFKDGSEQNCHEGRSSVQDSRTWVEKWNRIVARSFFTIGYNWFTLRCQYWTIDTLDNTEEGLAHLWTEDVVCAYLREVSFMLTLAWAQYLYTNSSAFLVRTNISISWLQGAVTWFQGWCIESKYVFQVNKCLVLVVLCCVRCWKTNIVKSEIEIIYKAN